MSWQAMGAAMDLCAAHDDLTTTDRLVLLVLAHKASKHGVAWPSSDTIADYCGVRSDTVRRSLARLVEAGHLAREERPGRPSMYRLSCPQPEALRPQVAETTCGPGATGVWPGSHRGVAPRARDISIHGQYKRAPEWCGPSCPTCDGTGWVHTPQLGGMSPCPERRPA